ncbi:hypothetical protein GJAV_G00242610 [Gymnothorax javanicus]|nr:hypothetical protein GJAV_G00242610 [Gymnothorax javanicus]
MTSAAPARKPYRKAPPQHREVRQHPPVFRDEPSAAPPPPQPEPCQVTPRQNRLPTPPPSCPGRYGTRPDSPELFSSSWSLASESEMDVSSLSSLDLTILPPPRIFSHGGLIAVAHPHGPGLFAGCRLDPLPPSQDDDDDRLPSPSRSLVFKEKAEILSPREHASAVLASSPPTKGILKQPNVPEGSPQPVDGLRKSKSAEVLGQNHVYDPALKSRSLERDQVRSPPSSAPAPAPTPTVKARQLQILAEKLRFSQFLDEITSRVLSPANLQLYSGGRRVKTGEQPLTPSAPLPDPQQDSLDGKSRVSEDQQATPRTDAEDRPQKGGEVEPWPQSWLISPQHETSDVEPDREQRSWGEAWREGARPKTGGPSRRWMGGGESQEDAACGMIYPRQHQGHQTDKWDASKCTNPIPLAAEKTPGSSLCISQTQDSLCDADKIKILQQQNEDLRRRLTHTTHKMEVMETEFQSSRHFMQAEIGRSKDDLEKMRDKFRRLQNSYTASQRANQDLEEKFHALLRKVDRDKKTMDQEIVELTNKLLDAKNTIDKLEELNERYRQDCNLAVQLLKCNKSHFRNHKFADLLSSSSLLPLWVLLGSSARVQCLGLASEEVWAGIAGQNRYCVEQQALGNRQFAFANFPPIDS